MLDLNALPALPTDTTPALPWERAWTGADGGESVYLDALQACATATWRLWGRRCTTATDRRDHSALEYRAGEDGFIDLTDTDALLAADPAFETVCNERRDGWIEAQEAEPVDGDLIDCRGCNGTGEGFLGGRCRDCAGQGYRVHREPRDDDRDGTAYAL